MRLLHDIHPNETLICQGQYWYLVGNQPTGEVETWQVTRLPDGTEIIRSDIDGREAVNGGNLLTHLLRQPGGQPRKLRLQYGKGDINAAAQYTFEDAQVRVARRAGTDPIRREVVEIAVGYQIDYHSVIAHDYVWRGYPRHARGKNWAIPVFSPDFWIESGDILVGRALRFNVKPLEADTCSVPAGDFENVRHFSITLSDGVQAEAWYDDTGIPLRWHYPAKNYDFVLVTYVRGEWLDSDQTDAE